MIGCWPALCIFAILWLTQYLYLVFWRLFCSPLAKFPGSKLAAATGWYEFYFDFWKRGKYTFEIERMHALYGPIIRVNPDEISIRDSMFYNELYVTGNQRRSEHYDAFASGIDFEGSSHILTRDHDLHRRRRKPLDPFFSRIGVQRLKSMLEEMVLKLESRIRDYERSHQVIRLDHAFSAFSSDVMCRLCLADGPNEEPRSDFLSHPDFSPEWFNCLNTMITSLPLFTGFPWIIQIINLVPIDVILKIIPSGKVFADFRKFSLESILKAIRLKEENDLKGVRTEDRGSIFLHLANSDMPASEKAPERLLKEAQVLLAGGTATTSHTLAFACCYVLSRSELRQKLKEELLLPMARWPSYVPPQAELEKLPFLTAIIKESLRLSYGVMHRLPRISPDVPIQYRQYTIPPGIPVGMSNYFMHTDPDVFPNPLEFRPERWMTNVTPEMLRNYVPFGRGSRNCLGQYLGLAELYLVLAMLFRPDGPALQLFETDESDVVRAHDFILALPRLDSKGLRVTVN
ncbi:cytochrome P450 [Boeremia exigua]|uniref:cytochrome P450 n=1 Tax=Boeremia exigua TaxID=749465 RepID=UPI001E8DFDFF|nr:cytochrome P450 [Boeremia exigua]KAH6615377.1 cytochrome P450 [Boeremia exigua]